MLQRLGTVRAISGLTPACFAKGDSKTAQMHLGALVIRPRSTLQQAGGTFALTFPTALRQGPRLAAADLIEILPHSPAPSTSFVKPQLEVTSNTSKATRLQGLDLEAIIVVFFFWLEAMDIIVMLKY